MKNDLTSSNTVISANSERDSGSYLLERVRFEQVIASGAVECLWKIMGLIRGQGVSFK